MQRNAAGVGEISADYLDRMMAERRRAMEEDQRQAPPGWLLDKWAAEKLYGKAAKRRRR